jgi:hypothetical protein
MKESKLLTRLVIDVGLCQVDLRDMNYTLSKIHLLLVDDSELSENLEDLPRMISGLQDMTRSIENKIESALKETFNYLGDGFKCSKD